MPRPVAITRTPSSISWNRSRSPVTTITSMPCSRASRGERGDHVVRLVALDPHVRVAEGLDERLHVGPLLAAAGRAARAGRLVLAVDLLAARHAGVPGHERRLDPYSVTSFTSIEAKPKIALVGSPRDVAIVSGRAKKAR